MQKWHSAHSLLIVKNLYSYALPSDYSLGNISYLCCTLFVCFSYVKDYSLNGSKRFEPKDTRGTIVGLKPGVVYTFSIEAYTRTGAGAPKLIHKKMPIRAPPRPDSAAKPEEVVKTSSTIAIRFRDNYFSNKNGAVKKYTIIVAENTDTDDEEGEPLTWSEVQSYSVWPSYQVLLRFEYC